MNARIALLVAAGFLLVVGLAFGLTTVEAGPNDSEPTSCGSPLAPSDDEAEDRDRVAYYSSGGDGESVEACDRARGKRQPVTYGALGLGVVAGLMSMVVPVKRD